MPQCTQDIVDPNTLKQKCVSFLNETVDELGISRFDQVNLPVLKKLKREDMAGILFESLCCLNDLTVSITDYTNSTTSIKSELFEAQRTIIKLQADLLACKNEQLDVLKVTVKSSVEDSVKAEFESYSSVVQKNCSVAQENGISSVDLKKAVKDVFQDEDRSKNMIIFGLPEENDEDLSASVDYLLQEIGEKPRYEACRMGRNKTDGNIRPIKVTTTSSTVVDQILFKARKLKQVEKYKFVYINPDRSPEQRNKRRDLVKELKRLSAADADKRYFIRNDKICSVNKTS